MAVPGATVTAATKAMPIVITTAGAHGLDTGNTVLIAGVVGNTAANGTFVITVIDTTNFSLNNSNGNANYVSGGEVTQVQTSPADVAGMNPVSDTSTSTGTGSILLNGLVSRYSTFDSVSKFCHYEIAEVGIDGVVSGDWEIGYGNYDPSSRTLSRDVVIASSATSNSGYNGLAGDLVDFEAGPKFVSLCVLSDPY